MANHRGVKLCREKGQYTENITANVWMSRTVVTDLYTQSRSSQLLRRYLLSLLRLQFCSTVDMTSRARQATMIMKTVLASSFTRDITHGKS